jgi:hypothetical protein
MTVASASGRYSRESVGISFLCCDGRTMEVLWNPARYQSSTTVNACALLHTASKNSFDVTVAHRRMEDLQYIPNTPKKPVKPRATNRGLTSRRPHGKCSVFLYHIYSDEQITVMLILANRI